MEYLTFMEELKKHILKNKEWNISEENYKFYKVKALGALLLAHNLKDFNLERKAVRIVIYNGITKSSIREQLEGKKGYAIGFENIIKVLKKYLPQE